MLEQLAESWALASVRDIAISLVGAVVLGGFLFLAGRRRAFRNLSEEHFYLAGVAVGVLALIGIGLYNRYHAG